MHRPLMGVAFAVALASGFGVSAAERPQPPAPQRVIVKFEGATPQRPAVADEVLRAVGAAHGTRFEKYMDVGTGAVSFWIRNARDDAHVDRVIAALARSPRVVYAERSAFYGTLLQPNDTRYGEQWHYHDPVGGINLPLAWDHPATGQGIVVAVVDTGIVPHADLNANVLSVGADMIDDIGYSMDGDGRDNDATDEGTWTEINSGGGLPNCPPSELCDNNPNQTLYPSSWHGTHVSGTIAAVTGNGLGVSGVAYNAKILPIRVVGKGGYGTLEDVAAGILWAVGAPLTEGPPQANTTPAHVINISLGKVEACSPTLESAIAIARSYGANVVVAAGNGAPTVGANGYSPGNCAGAFTVAALNRQAQPASYASVGSVVEIAAPGGEMPSANHPDGVLSTMNTGTQGPGSDTYAYYDGSSMAAPHVAGVLALVRELNPTFTVAQAEQHLLDTARTINCPGCNNRMVDALAAVTSNTSLPTVALSLAVPSLSESGGSVAVTATLSSAYAHDVTVQLAFAGTAQTSDYSAPSTIVVPANQTSASIMLAATHDTTQESHESVVVTAQSAAYGYVGTSSQVTVTIVDDDSPAFVSFASATYAKREGTINPYASITISRTGNLATQVSVNVTRTGGTAGASDYVMPASSTVTFLPNQTSKSFQIEVIDDSTPENEESIKLNLSNPTGGAAISSPSTTTLWINCNDGYSGCS
jgi:serine protease